VERALLRAPRLRGDATRRLAACLPNAGHGREPTRPSAMAPHDHATVAL